jgi:hypothetical protein
MTDTKIMYAIRNKITGLYFAAERSRDDCSEKSLVLARLYATQDDAEEQLNPEGGTDEQIVEVTITYKMTEQVSL